MVFLFRRGQKEFCNALIISLLRIRIVGILVGMLLTSVLVRKTIGEGRWKSDARRWILDATGFWRISQSCRGSNYGVFVRKAAATGLDTAFRSCRGNNRQIFQRGAKAEVVLC